MNVLSSELVLPVFVLQTFETFNAEYIYSDYIKCYVYYFKRAVIYWSSGGPTKLSTMGGETFAGVAPQLWYFLPQYL